MTPRCGDCCAKKKFAWQIKYCRPHQRLQEEEKHKALHCAVSAQLWLTLGSINSHGSEWWGRMTAWRSHYWSIKEILHNLDVALPFMVNGHSMCGNLQKVRSIEMDNSLSQWTWSPQWICRPDFRMEIVSTVKSNFSLFPAELEIAIKGEKFHLINKVKVQFFVNGRYCHSVNPNWFTDDSAPWRSGNKP